MKLNGRTVVKITNIIKALQKKKIKTEKDKK